MKKLKLIITLFGLGSLFALNAADINERTTTSEQPPRSLPTSQRFGDYYTQKNIQGLIQKGKPYHAPLYMIIDNKRHETNGEIGALTVLLKRFVILEDTGIPTLVSFNVIKNLLELLTFAKERKEEKTHLITKDEKNTNLKILEILLSQFDIYDFPGTPFVFMVPHKNTLIFGNKKIFAYKNLTEIHPLVITLLKKLNTELDLEKITALKNIKSAPEEQLDPFIKQKAVAFDPKKLEELFILDDPNAPIWDIVLNGHGRSRQIAGLPAKDTQKLLYFFNTKIKTGSVYILSCHAGGKNLSLLEFDTSIDPKKAFMPSLNFLVIVGAISDKPIGGSPKFFSLLLNNFFQLAPQLSGRGLA